MNEPNAIYFSILTNLLNSKIEIDELNFKDSSTANFKNNDDEFFYLKALVNPENEYLKILNFSIFQILNRL